MERVKLIGIVNITPDSFSDGGQFYSLDSAIAHAQKLKEDGADIIDIGGDSTRPGSICTGAEEEWNRIEGAITQLASQISISVDTHHSSTAKKALALGAKIINDISAGSDPKMFEIVASANAQIILMYSRCPKPHEFAGAAAGDLISKITEFLKNRTDRALAAGIAKEKIILDPGMGAFLSEDPECSWELIRRFNELSKLGFPLCFASSRKRFLRAKEEKNPSERDPVSAQTACLALSNASLAIEYIRTHNVKLQRQFLETKEYTPHDLNFRFLP